MSIPYEQLHKAALPFVPEGTIGKTSAWVAVALHTINSIKDIKNRRDFLFIKCHKVSSEGLTELGNSNTREVKHGRKSSLSHSTCEKLTTFAQKITVRTIKHEYFIRHPLERFEIKFVNGFLPDAAQIYHLKKINPIPESNVLALRVIEEDNLGTEIEMEKEESFIQKIKAQVHSGRGKEPTRPIELDAEIIEHELAAVAPVSGSKRKRAQLDDPDDEDLKQQVSGDSPAFPDADTPYSNAAFEEAMEGTDYEVLKVDPDAYDAFTHRLQSASRETQILIDKSPWTTCEACGKIMHVKPWTEFGPAGKALCSTHSREQLRQQSQYDAAEELSAACREECAEKKVRMAKGVQQNLSQDTPYDWTGSREDGARFIATLNDEEKEEVKRSNGESNGRGGMIIGPVHRGDQDMNDDASEVELAISESPPPDELRRSRREEMNGNHNGLDMDSGADAFARAQARGSIGSEEEDRPSPFVRDRRRSTSETRHVVDPRMLSKKQHRPHNGAKGYAVAANGNGDTDDEEDGEDVDESQPRHEVEDDDGSEYEDCTSLYIQTRGG